jgi:surfeit locus 1 family protein
MGIVLQGTFDHDREIVLRGRAHNGAPGVEIATPFRVAGRDTAFIVIRGFVPSDDAMSVDLTALQEPGVRTIRGVLFPLPMVGTPAVRNDRTTWDAIPGGWLRVRSPYPVMGYAVWQERDSGMPGLPIRLGAPALTEGPHLSYAIQWFAFALIFAGGGFAYSFGQRSKDRETRDEIRETRDGGGTYQES